MKYIIRLEKDGKRGYYSREHRWEMVMKFMATRMNHKTATLIRNKFKALHMGYSATVVEVEK